MISDEHKPGGKGGSPTGMGSPPGTGSPPDAHPSAVKTTEMLFQKKIINNKIQ